MKKLTPFETSIIGLFIGVITAAYVVFIDSNGGFIGMILKWLSLLPVLDMLHLSIANPLVTVFVFVVVVYTIYGCLIGLILKKVDIGKWIIGLSAILIVCIFLEQRSGVAPLALSPDVPLPQVAAVVRTVEKVPEQYFGTEATGDLNGDAADDIAFVISRSDEERGTLYYLAASLALDRARGHAGTNLIFLGDKVEPQKLNIENSIIVIEYIDHASPSTATKKMYSQVIEGILTSTTTSHSPEIDHIDNSAPIH